MISEEINEGLFAKPSALYVRTTAEKFDIKSAATEAAAKGNTSCQSRPTGRWRDRQLERRGPLFDSLIRRKLPAVTSTAETALQDLFHTFMTGDSLFPARCCC